MDRAMDEREKLVEAMQLRLLLTMGNIFGGCSEDVADKLANEAIAIAERHFAEQGVIHEPPGCPTPGGCSCVLTAEREAEIRAGEREACAKVCDVASDTVSIGHDSRRVEGYSYACKVMAAAIRARGNAK